MINKTILSYLYWQYNDDENIQSFVNAYNIMSQEYIDFFNAINLPIYTQDQISGNLLDWVAEGLYGLKRVTIGLFFINQFIGSINSYAINTYPTNGFSGSTNYTLTDDVFKRVITWNFYKGDGTVFNVIWLKRRIERFLFGENGTDYSNPTYRISVSFSSHTHVVIGVINTIVIPIKGGIINFFSINTVPINTLTFTIQHLHPIALASMLEIAINSGLLQTPFQFTFSVNIA